MEILPRKQKIYTLSEQSIIKSRIIRKWNKLLKTIFEIGYYDDAPKWYWLAVKSTLEKSDEIINYIPNEFEDCYYYDHVTWFSDEVQDIELMRMESLEGETVISCCWKLLDRLHYKIKGRNLYNAYCGFLNIFHKVYDEYEFNYKKNNLII